MDYLYSDFEILQERFCIMTVEGGLSDRQALESLQSDTDTALFSQLEAWAIAHPWTASPGRDYLQMYIQNRIALYPCNQSARPLVKIYDKSNGKNEIIRENQILTAENLEHWKSKNVSMFSFIPANSNLLILDLDNSDTHANKANGIENFKRLVNPLNLNDKLKLCFSDFPRRFPCYVETVHGGLHLYFKASYVTDRIKQLFDNARMNAQNIEIKYKTQCTAGGSIREGKEYNLRGRLPDAPEITLDLLEAITKPQQTKRIEKPYFNKYNSTGSGNKWNESPEGIIEKASGIYADLAPHDFVYKTAVLFARAGFDEKTTIQHITQTPQHLQRNNKADTISAIQSIFKGVA